MNVERDGMPTDSEIALPVRHDGVTTGYFMLTASTRIARPSDPTTASWRSSLAEPGCARAPTSGSKQGGDGDRLAEPIMPFVLACHSPSCRSCGHTVNA